MVKTTNQIVDMGNTPFLEEHLCQFCDSKIEMPGEILFFQIAYPLVNVDQKLWKITMFNGKINYFYGHFQ